MSSPKKIYLLRDWAAGVFLSAAQNSLPRPPYTLYTCIVYLFTQGRGGRVESERRGEEQQGIIKITRLNMTECTQENSDKHLPQISFPGQFF
jgi:hypothetical protein